MKRGISETELQRYLKMDIDDLKGLPKKELDRLRSRIIDSEPIKVKYTGNISGFHRGKTIEAIPRFATGSGLPYPLPKHRAVDFRIIDEDGDSFTVAKDAKGPLYKGFERAEDDKND